MKVKEIVQLCNEICNLELPQNTSTELTEETANANETARKLIVCCNSVLEDLYCNYGADIATCEVTAQDGFVDTSELDLCRVLKLKDSQGANVKFRYTADGLFVGDGKYVLTYAKLPKTVEWNSEVRLPSPRITERVLVYGILSRYFSIVEDLERAENWEARYQNALRAVRIKSSSMTMPTRRWE